MQTSFQRKEDIYNLFMQAPVGIYLLKGPEYVIEMANEPILHLWGKGPGVIGKPVLESFPEVEEQGFIELLDKVRTTGIPFQTDEIPVWYNYDGVKKQKYVTLLYQPLYEEGLITGIFSIATDVTEKVIAKRKLQQSEQNMRNVIMQAPVAMCIFKGSEYIVEIANERMFSFWGKPGKEVLHKPIFEGLPEAKNQGFEDLLYRVLNKGETIQASERPVTLPRNGGLETVYVNFLYEPFREEDGQITGVMAIALEVTEQVLARKKIEESEQRVRSVVESAPFPIGVYVGREMRIALANRSLIDVWGKGPDIIGKTYAEMLPELKGTGIYEKLDNVYSTGIPYHTRNQRVDLVWQGKLQPFYFNYSFTPLFDSEGKVYGVMNTAAEITDLIIARQKVEQSERNFRSMVLQAPVAMCIMLGPDYVVDIANEMMIALWGKPREQVMHRPIFEGLPDAREQGFEKLLEQVFTKGEAYTAFERPVTLVRNGSMETVYQNFVYEPYRDSEGNILGVLAISVDVTQQVLARHQIEEVVALRTRELAMANESLLKTNQDLQHTNANLEEFAYAASHDLKEPIRKIHFFSDRIRNDLYGQLNAQQLHWFERLENATLRMGTLVDDLLAYSQVTRGAGDRQMVDLSKTIQMVLEDLELEIQQKNALIKIETMPTLRGNPRQLQQLFQNLVSNALKYSKPGVYPEIVISSRIIRYDKIQAGLKPDQDQEGYYLIEVKDNGIGFAQEDAERIFHVFTRLHNNIDYRGTGIGLSIVQKVAESHRGRVWAESEEGKGSMFKILLPA